MKFDLNKVWDKTKKTAFKEALNRSSLIERKGGTGEKRKPLTQKQYEKRKKRLKMQKESRKQNRKVG